MKHKYLYFLLTLLMFTFCNNGSQHPRVNPSLKWSKISDISTLDSFNRIEAQGYGDWVRRIKLNEDNIVYYYNGAKKHNQKIHIAVLDFDIGNRDLQQCADACMRI